MTNETAAPWNPQPGPAEPPSSRSEINLSWFAPFGMIGLSLVNFFYRLITLGIYDFWARTEVRKRLWSAIRLNGEPLVYTGTGKELFLGFLIVFGVVLLPIMLISFGAVFAFGPRSTFFQIFNVALYAFAFFLFGVGIFRAQRYRLLRTTWRGIRGSLSGDSWKYGLTYFLTILLVPLTLGWIVPWRTTKLQSMITNNAYFGDQPFSFKGGSGPLYGPFALLWFGVLFLSIGTFMIIGIIMQMVQRALGPGALEPGFKMPSEIAAYLSFVTLSILAVGYLLYLFISAWYRSRTINHFAQCTHFDDARFEGRVTGGGLLWIDITNLLIQILGVVLMLIPVLIIIALIAAAGLGPQEANLQSSQIGLANGFLAVFAPISVLILALSFTLLLPVTQARSMGYLIRNLSLNGSVDVDKISQSTAQQMSTGEGLAQAFDIDAF